MSNIIFWSGIFSPKPSTEVTNTSFSFSGNWTQRPMASYQLSWWLRKHRFSCQVIEFVQLLTAKELIEFTEPFIQQDTLTIAMSTIFWPVDGQVPENIVEAIDYFRRKYPKIKIIAGGNRSSRESYSFLNFDKVFLLEAENDLLTYLQELKFSMKMPNPKFDITHLEHRFIKTDAILEHETLPIELGRGCIFKCKFCNYMNIGKKKHTYQRHFDYIVDEIKYNKDSFNTTNYVFLDDTVNEDPEKVKNMSLFSKKLGFDISWIGYLRPDLIYRFPESAHQLKESGLITTFFGLESFHPEASKIIGKGWIGKQAKDWLPVLYNDLWNKEVNIFGNFILGLPKEPIESWIDTYKWCRENNFGQWSFYPLVLKANNEEHALKSEFDKNYSLYGYKVHSDDRWELGNITFDIAMKYAKGFNIRLHEFNRVSGFNVANFLNLGFDFNTIRNLNVNDAFDHLSSEKMINFKNRYLKQLTEVINNG